ncbi:Protein trafficking PGA2 [Aspergillus sp. HF37]|nr:Protein trafficking PGA2 [Aspergillus sp. HF37]
MADESSPASDALTSFANSVISFFQTIFRRFLRNTKASVTEVSRDRWTKVIISVVVYILIRPYIERFFKYMHDRDRAKAKQKEKEKADAWEEKNRRARVSANELRAAGSSAKADAGGGGEGKVLGEIDSEEDVEEAEDEAKASGVPEWGKLARRRQKQYFTSLQKNQQPRAEELSDKQMLELLDWSESEEEKAGS